MAYPGSFRNVELHHLTTLVLMFDVDYWQCIFVSYVCFCTSKINNCIQYIKWISITCCVHYSHAAKVRGLCVMYSRTPSKQGCWRWTSLATCGTIERSSCWICPASAWCMDFQISAKPNQLNFGNGWTTTSLGYMVLLSWHQVQHDKHMVWLH